MSNHKKQKVDAPNSNHIDSSSSKSSSYIESSNTSTGSSIRSNKVPSAKNWFKTKQLSKFNISFVDIVSENVFFESMEIAPTPENINELIQATWDRKPPEKWHSSLEGKLISDCDRYQCAVNEAAVNEAFSSLLKLIDIPSDQIQMQVAEKFGRIDIAVVDTFYNAVIKNKSGGRFKHKIENHESQIAAYFISAGIANQIDAGKLEKNFGSQHIVGIINFGLTPIFYKAEITESYLKSIKAAYEDFVPDDVMKIEPLKIFRFKPIKMPFSDRELLIPSSRDKIFKYLFAFKSLCKKYGEQKINMINPLDIC